MSIELFVFFPIKMLWIKPERCLDINAIYHTTLFVASYHHNLCKFRYYFCGIIKKN